MAVFGLAVVGGLISFLSTALGAVFSFFSTRRGQSFRWNLSIDFALGLMISASAFTLIGPVALDAQAQGQSLLRISVAALVGILFVLIMKSSIRILQKESHVRTSHLILASVLMLHNFPEGLASGAALAGLGWQASFPILGGISIQNIPEGALMVFCLRSMGWSHTAAFLGGLGSGLVEMMGGSIAGLLLQSVQNVLPLLLSAAGGAMIASVVVELKEGGEKFWARIFSRQFAGGFFTLWALQYLTNG